MTNSAKWLFYLEWVAVIMAVIYVLLAVREHRACWIMAILSSIAYIPVFYFARLYMESVLQVFFIIIAFAGWYRWYDLKTGSALKISSLRAADHLKTVVVYLVFAALLGEILKRYTDASFPYLDSIVTSFSIAASFMQTRKIIDNWLYWILIDCLAVYIYIRKELNLTAGLYCLFLILAVRGYNQWSHSSRRSTEGPVK